MPGENARDRLCRNFVTRKNEYFSLRSEDVQQLFLVICAQSLNQRLDGVFGGLVEIPGFGCLLYTSLGHIVAP